MKKLIFIIGFLCLAVASFGQRWTTVSTYKNFYLDSIQMDSLIFIVQGQQYQAAILRSSLDSVYLVEATEIAGGLSISPTEKSYINGLTSNAQTQLDAKLNESDTIDANVRVWMLADTVVLGAFSAIDSFNTSFIYGSFYNNGSDTLVVTEMGVSCLGTTVSFTVDIEWHATLGSVSATGLNTTPPTIDQEDGTITSDTSFDNAQIPPGVQVWLKTPTVTTAPTYLSVTLLGYRKNSTY